MFYCKAVTLNGPVCPFPRDGTSNKYTRRPPTITIKGQVPKSQPTLATSLSDSSNSVNGASTVNVQSELLQKDHPLQLRPIIHSKTNGSVTRPPMSPPKITVRGSSQRSTTTNPTDTDMPMISSGPRSPPRITRSINPPSSTPTVTDQFVVLRPRSPPRIVIKSNRL